MIMNARQSLANAGIAACLLAVLPISTVRAEDAPPDILGPIDAIGLEIDHLDPTAAIEHVQAVDHAAHPLAVDDGLDPLLAEKRHVPSMPLESHSDPRHLQHLRHEVWGLVRDEIETGAKPAAGRH